MATKKIILEIPHALNKQLSNHLEDLRDLGVKTTKAELCLKLIQVGLNGEKK